MLIFYEANIGFVTLLISGMHDVDLSLAFAEKNDTFSLTIFIRFSWFRRHILNRTNDFTIGYKARLVYLYTNFRRWKCVGMISDAYDNGETEQPVQCHSYLNFDLKHLCKDLWLNRMYRLNTSCFFSYRNYRILTIFSKICYRDFDEWID